jgi:hypothetical protein
MRVAIEWLREREKRIAKAQLWVAKEKKVGKREKRVVVEEEQRVEK